MQINEAAIVAELASCYEKYEKALAGGDASLDDFFRDSPHGLLLGVTDREIHRRDSLSFGDSAGIVNLEFMRPVDGGEQYGRETQFWFRFDDGWKIVSAHGSWLPALKPASDDTLYLKSASAKIGLGIDSLYEDQVKADLGRLATVAEFLMQFPLPQDVEPAPVFQP